MLASHWMKAAFVLLHLAAVAFALSHCGRPAGTAPTTAGKPEKDKGKSPAWERAAQREKERKAHELAVAKRRADHQKLEAELRAIAKIHLPAALDELAEAAAAYRRKISDLARLKKEEQWEREGPVKEALARARALTADYYAADREAQKGRDGPTLHPAEDADALAKRIDAFKRGGEEFGAFAKLLPPLYGKIPEKLLLEAIEVMARAALPADAFDSCARDPSTCPKPPPPPPAPPVAVSPVAPPAPPVAAVKSGACVRASASPHHLTVHTDPDTTAAVITRLAPRQCGILRTGFTDAYHGPAGWSAWEEINVNGHTGWIREGVLPPAAGPAPSFAAEFPSLFRERPYKPRYRGGR
jgi:hypothetical protein